MISATDVWPIVKLRLGLADDTKKQLIDSYIAEIGLHIQHYCNLRTVPDGLLYTWASMVMDAVRVELPNDDEIADTAGGAVNVKVGDTSVSYGGGAGGSLSNTAKTVIDQVVLNYRVDLNRFRRMGGWR